MTRRIALLLILSAALVWQQTLSSQTAVMETYREETVLRAAPVTWSTLPNGSEGVLLTAFRDTIWLVDTAQSALITSRLTEPPATDSSRTREAGGVTRRTETVTRNTFPTLRRWPLPASLATSVPRVLKCLPFASDRAWLVDQSNEQAWLLVTDVWHGPWPLGEAVSGATALLDGTLILTTPRHANYAFLAMNSSGEAIKRFGTRLTAAPGRLDESVNRWVLAALSRGGFLAINRATPAFRRYTNDGVLVWDRERAGSPRSSGAMNVATGPDDRVAVRDSAGPVLNEYDSSGEWVKTLTLRGTHAADPWTILGLGYSGKDLVVADPSAISLFSSLSGPGVLSGLVVDAANAPVKLASVSVTTEAGTVVHETTADDGRFVISRIPGDMPVQVEVGAQGFLSRQLSGALSSIVATPIALERGPSQCVKVIDKDTLAPVSKFSAVLLQNLATADSVTRRAGPKQDISTKDGTGCVAAPWPAPWIIRIEAEGYASFESRRAIEEPSALLAIALEPDAKFMMHVQDADQKPVSGANITVDEADRVQRSAMARSGDRVVRTNDDGVAEVPRLAAGEYRVSVTHPDFLNLEETVTIKRNEKPVDITLSRGAAVLVQVVSDGQQPISAASVQLSSLGGPPLAHTLSCKTSLDGSCTITAVAPGNYEAFVTSPDRARARQRFGLPPGQADATVTVVLRHGVRVTGSVRGRDHYPNTRFDVAISVPGTPLLASPVTDNGRFAVNDVASGIASVWIRDRRSGTALAFDRIEIPDALKDSFEITVELPLPSRVNGTISRAGAGCAGCRIVFTRQGAEMGRPEVAGASAFDGTYAIDVPSTGLYSVLVRDPSDGQTINDTLQVDGDRQADYQIGGLALIGRVYNGEDHSAVAQAVVACFSLDASTKTAEAITDDTGRFRLTGLRAGAYRLTATADQASGSVEVQVNSENSSADVPIRASMGLRVRLIDTDSGLPVWSVAARVGVQQGRATQYSNLYADSKGVVTVPLAPETGSTVVLKATGYAYKMLRNVTPTASVMTVGLSPGGRSFWVESAPAKPPCALELIGTDGAPAALSLMYDPGPVPLFVPKAFFSEVEAGSYRAVLHYCSGKTETVPLLLTPGTVPVARFLGQ